MNGNRLREWLESLRGHGGASIAPADVRFILPVTDPVIVPRRPVTALLSVPAAGVRVRLSDAKVYAHSFAVVAGPRADGLTPNAATVFLGGPGVGAADGSPLAPGDSFAGESTDLADWSFVATDAADVLRLIYEVGS